jgi:two-component system sensor histidine kinase QseC
MISIRRQLTRKLLGAVLLILIGGLGALYFGAREVATDQFDRTIHAKALAISTLTFQTAEGFRFEFTDRFMRGFDEHKSRDYFQLWEASGREIARSESMPGGANLPRRAGKIDHPAEWNVTLPNGRPGRALGFAFKPKVTDPALHGREKELHLVVVSDREDLDETLWELLALSAGWALLLVSATLWVIPRVLRSGLQPLDELGERAARIDADSLGTRFTLEDLPEELRPIGQRLNDLFGRLEQSFDRERRFSANLAHELRTPLAELRSMAECALKWPESRDPSVDQETLAIAQQMERIVTHILALVRGEEGQLAVTTELTAVGQLVRDTWEGFAARAAERGLNASLQIEETECATDPALLRSILTNLCDNAVGYTPAGGEIVIAVRRRSDRVVITMANSTSDLEEEDLPKLFDRFWRKEAARSGGLHLGLGLSLSRTFAKAMGWEIVAAFDGQNHLVFTLSGLITVAAVNDTAGMLARPSADRPDTLIDQTI